jgi:hypothetical protein
MIRLLILNTPRLFAGKSWDSTVFALFNLDAILQALQRRSQ